jgi:hypothetical protein
MDNPTRLWVGLPATLDRPVLKAMVNELCGGTSELEFLPPDIIPLYLDRANIDVVVASMPDCNEWGILPTWVSPDSLLGNASPARGGSDYDS